MKHVYTQSITVNYARPDSVKAAIHGISRISCFEISDIDNINGEISFKCNVLKYINRELLNVKFKEVSNTCTEIIVSLEYPPEYSEEVSTVFRTVFDSDIDARKIAYLIAKELTFSSQYKCDKNFVFKEIDNLVELRNQNLITDPELNTKKKELLKLI